MTKSDKRKLRRLFAKKFKGARWRWRKVSDAGFCVPCGRATRGLPRMTAVYRGTEWRADPYLPHVGSLFYTDSVCLDHAVEKETRGGEREVAVLLETAA